MTFTFLVARSEEKEVGDKSILFVYLAKNDGSRYKAGGWLKCAVKPATEVNTISLLGKGKNGVWVFSYLDEQYIRLSRGQMKKLRDPMTKIYHGDSPPWGAGAGKLALIPYSGKTPEEFTKVPFCQA